MGIQDINLALRPPNSPDPSINQRLALAVTKAREGGMTKAAIEGLFDRVSNTLSKPNPSANKWIGEERGGWDGSEFNVRSDGTWG